MSHPTPSTAVGNSIVHNPPEGRRRSREGSPRRGQGAGPLKARPCLLRGFAAPRPGGRPHPFRMPHQVWTCAGGERAAGSPVQERGIGRSVGRGGSSQRRARSALPTGRRRRQRRRPQPAPAPQAARRPANPPGRISSENSEMAYQYFPLSGIRPMPSRSKWRSSSSIHRSRLSL